MRLENGTIPELASPGHRIAAIAVDAGLNLVTFGIGWFIWSLVTWAEGQTPAKKLLKIRVINASNGKPARWGQMCIRQVLVPWAMGLFFLIPYYVWLFKGFGTPNGRGGLIALILCILVWLTVVIIDVIWLFGPRKRRLVDYWVGTFVINEANLAKN